MIISRTPFRISLFGGGTDYPQWYLNHGGAVLGFSINKYCYISLRPLPPFFPHRHKVAYSQVEEVEEISEIRHPAVRAVLTEHPVSHGISLHHESDLPARTGLGSSSAFTVGLLNALAALRGRAMTERQLAEEAIRIEQQVIGEHVGSQDQVWAAFGGCRRIDFSSDNRFSVLPVMMSVERRQALTGRLMMFFTGISRYASDIARDKIKNLERRADDLIVMREMVDTAQNILQDGSRELGDIGRMLHEHWLMKRQLADKVSNEKVDEIYAEALAAGAAGGKLLGAGGGGFMVFYVEPENQQAVLDRLSGLIHVKFGLSLTGSRIVIYEPDGLENH